MSIRPNIYNIEKFTETEAEAEGETEGETEQKTDLRPYLTKIYKSLVNFIKKPGAVKGVLIGTAIVIIVLFIMMVILIVVLKE